MLQVHLTEVAVPICILGSSRSGTSMVTRLLNLCGLYLGPREQIAGAHERSNPAGYWENLAIQAFNEELLNHLGGAWFDPPDTAPGWSQERDIDSFRERALALVAPLAQVEPWGWKDPRNSLTLEFWQSLLPGLIVVVCLRNPLEAATSIRKAVIGSDLDVPVRELNYAIDLWSRYQRRIWELLEPGSYLVTHYESYFHDPRAELSRLLAFLEITPSDAAVNEALATIDSGIRRNIVSRAGMAEAVPRSIIEQYTALCEEAGPVFRTLC